MLLNYHLASAFLLYLSAGVSGDSVLPNIITTFAPLSSGQVTITMTFDALGNVYHTNTYSIKRIDAITGTTTTVAGTTDLTSGSTADNIGALDAYLLGGPIGVAVDAQGNIYFSEYNSNRVRKVDATTKILTTLAGQDGVQGYSGDDGQGSLALLSRPVGLALDNFGNLYVADSMNSCIRKLNVNTGVITTVAGNGVASYYGDNVPATSALLNEPFAIALDEAGSLFIADTNNHCIRKITADIITTVAGSCGTLGVFEDGSSAATSLLYYPFGVATSTSGNIYIINFPRILVVDVITNQVTVFAGSGSFDFNGDGIPALTAGMDPTHVILDKAGKVYLSDTRNDRIRLVTIQPPPSSAPPSPEPSTPPSPEPSKSPVSCRSKKPTRVPTTAPTKRTKRPTKRPIKCST